MTLSHHRVAPHAVFSRQALEALDLLLAFITLLRVTVPTHPFVHWNLKCGMNVHMKALRHKIHSYFDLNVVMETLAYPRFFL